ncbi:urate hydroxylase PuuD [Persicimonas caeni]|uniref:Urate hydroxylase PuuD n=1 Tax=Persicimonas caeni TaxID=2292766 RepID=A0A4Y6PTR9_PERCE|nr:urate hydroxylase PuuD [Persicimonas caeni]QDG51633.1 urate hydroxylase PuuD [Persicimonas caeni]QED32854.1 urate hydroxylase PuuD [Persicimonas caeni]
MTPHFNEWLDLTIRWLHVIAGVAWIGTSFYFVWLENLLERGKDSLPEGVEGDLWAVHGGGFYHLKKFEVAPDELPETLHWFKWEAYFTWIFGLSLLIVVYYLNAGSMMIDPGVADITSTTAVAIGAGSIVGGWVVYDVLCRTPLLKRPTLFLAVMYGLMVASAFILSEVLSARAAYIHIGAMIGTMMAGNVFFVIIPNQKKMVQAAEEGREPEASDGQYASLRSRHNNYFTLPVLFIMVSNHFPSTYGNEYGWAILAGLSAIGIAVRHHFNVRHKTNKWAWTMAAALVGMVALGLVTSPGFGKADEQKALEQMEPVAFQEVQGIINARCVQCHSQNPTDDVFKVPQGVVFDTPADIKKYAPRIKVRTYDQKTMPIANKTGMTDEERKILGAWVVQGAKIE